MDFNQYQQLAMRTASGMFKEGLILNGVMGLCGEAGECIDIVKKYKFQGHPLDEEKLKDEASDCLWYIASIASGLGLTFNEIAEHNINKLKKRYPDGFDAERSLNRPF